MNAARRELVARRPGRRSAVGAFVDGSRSGPALLAAMVRLRWFAIAGQTLAIATALFVWQAPLPLAPLGALIALAIGTNLGLPHLASRRGALSTNVLGSVLLVDVTVLTALLGLSGGPANPFSSLYLVYVVLGAIITDRLWTWSLVAACGLGFALLFFLHIPLPPELGGHAAHTAEPYSAHLQGMWVSHVLAACCIALFVGALSRALRDERERRDRAARLLGLATLAAGAAHEIGNPLGTITVAAGELEAELSAAGLSPEGQGDLRLIQEQVARARAVLGRLASAAGELRGESPRQARLDEVVASALEQLGASAAHVRVDLPEQALQVRWPVQAVAQALVQLLRNGVDAQRLASTTNPAAARDVVCQVRAEADGVAVSVQDWGAGMDGTILARLGEPFFTTRTGSGMGLGVFIARSLIEHLGGLLAFESKPGIGTLARLWLPVGVDPRGTGTNQ